MLNEILIVNFIGYFAFLIDLKDNIKFTEKNSESKLQKHWHIFLICLLYLFWPIVLIYKIMDKYGEK